MEKDIIKGQYQKPTDHPLPTPAKRSRLTQREAQIKQRFRDHKADGVTPIAVALDASDAAVTVDASPIVSPKISPIVSIDATTEPLLPKSHDPVGWLLKRFGLLFLAALTIAIVLLIALPHVHATQASHSEHLRPRAVSPSRL
jgi:hypothetical protein